MLQHGPYTLPAPSSMACHGQRDREQPESNNDDDEQHRAAVWRGQSAASPRLRRSLAQGSEMRSSCTAETKKWRD